jgi:hypothetical protein
MVVFNIECKSDFYLSFCCSACLIIISLTTECVRHHPSCLAADVSLYHYRFPTWPCLPSSLSLLQINSSILIDYLTVVHVVYLVMIESQVSLLFNTTCTTAPSSSAMYIILALKTIYMTLYMYLTICKNVKMVSILG